MIVPTLTRRARHIRDSYLFLAPLLIGFIGLIAIPLGYCVWQGFHQEAFNDMGERIWQYNGIQHFVTVFWNDDAWRERIMPDLIRFVVVQLPLIQVFALAFGVLLNKEFPLRGFYRAVLFLPVIMLSGNVYTILGDNGGFRYPMIFMEFPRMVARFLFSDESFGTLMVQMSSIVTTVITTCGVQTLIVLSALQSVPGSLYEAAHVDGCTEWEAFWKISLPFVSPFVLVNVVYTLMSVYAAPWNQFGTYVSGFLMGAGRKGDGADLGYASAFALVYALIILALIAISLLIGRKTVSYSGERD